MATAVTSTVLLVVLAAAAIAGIRSTRPLALGEGSAENVFDDLADVLQYVPGLRRMRLPRESRRLALAAAAAAAAGVAVAGIVGMDPLDGLVRAIAEGIAVLCCYAALGRQLGLRRETN